MVFIATWEVLQIDTDSIEQGKFYRVYTDSNATTLLLPMEEQPALPRIVEFSNATYINEVVSMYDVISIFRTEIYKDTKKHTDITGNVNWYIEETNDIFHLKAHFDRPLTGYIKLK